MPKLFNGKDRVLTTGRYRCLSCGEVLLFKAGEYFSPCPRCQAGTSEGPLLYQTSDIEFWELINDSD